MAKTFNKPLRSIVITTIGGATISAEDTATDPIASDALSEFAMFKTMHVRTGDGEVTYVPFHAVDNIVVTTTSSEVEKADPYFCDEDTDGDDNGES